MKRLLCSVVLITFAARATEPAPPPPSDEIPAPAPSSDEPSWNLRVHLLTKDGRVELRRLTDNALICKTPCGSELQFHEDDQFVLGGQGLLRSVPFQLRPRDGEVTLRVSSGDVTPLILGGVTLSVGSSMAMISGLFYAINGSIPAGLFCDEDAACHARENAAKADAQSTARTVAFVGLGVAAVGGLILLLTHRTSYTVEE
jgi:hypothetical protein